MLLAGEAGIGKSRLVEALSERLAPEPHARISLQGTRHHAGSPLWPVVSYMERAAGFTRHDDAATKLTKLEALLLQAVDDISGAAPLLAGLLSIPTEGRYASLDLSPQRQREHTFAALLEQFVGLAARQPVLAVFADAHWFDSSTLELVDRIVERLEYLPICAVISFRPDFIPPWKTRPYTTSLVLGSAHAP